MEARSAVAPRIVSAVRHGNATVTMPAAAHSNAPTSHAGRASASEDRTIVHWSLMARTTKAPATTPMTAPTAVESRATRFFLSGCLLGTRTGLHASASPHRERSPHPCGPGDTPCPRRLTAGTARGSVR